MVPRNEVHLCHADSGHENSVSCWCEPVRIYWFTNRYNITMLVVEHEDDIPVPRAHRLALREQDKHLVNIGRDWGIDEPWITRRLEAVPVVPPPPDHNERNL